MHSMPNESQAQISVLSRGFGATENDWSACVGVIACQEDERNFQALEHTSLETTRLLTACNQPSYYRPSRFRSSVRITHILKKCKGFGKKVTTGQTDKGSLSRPKKASSDVLWAQEGSNLQPTSYASPLQLSLPLSGLWAGLSLHPCKAFRQPPCGRGLPSSLYTFASAEALGSGLPSPFGLRLPRI